MENYNKIMGCLQRQYLLDGTKLDEIYTEAKKIALVYLYNVMKLKSLCFDEDRIYQITHDASTEFIVSNYLTKKNIIQYFYTMISYNVKQQLGWAKRGRHSKQRHWDKIYPLNDEIYYNDRNISVFDDKLLWLKELADKNKDIIYHLYKERSFKSAILKIKDAINDDRYIIDNWKKLYFCYSMIWKNKRLIKNNYLFEYFKNKKALQCQTKK